MEDQNEEIEKRLQKLARIEQKGKEQSARWLKEQRAKGKRQISGLIDQAEYQILSDVKDAGDVVGNPISTGQVLGYALRMIKRLCDSDIDLVYNIVNNIVDTTIEKSEPSTLNNAGEKTKEQKGREYEHLKKIEEIRAKERSLANLKQGEDIPDVENLPTRETGRSRDIAASKLGMSGKTAEKVAAVVEAIDILEVNGKQGEEEPEPHKETLQELDLSGYDLQNLSIDDRDKIIFQVYEKYPERQHAQLRVDFLNQQGALFSGNPWTKKQFTDQLSRARERMKIKQEK